MGRSAALAHQERASVATQVRRMDDEENRLQAVLGGFAQRMNAVIAARLVSAKERKHTRHWFGPAHGEVKALDTPKIIDLARWIEELVTLGLPHVFNVYAGMYVLTQQELGKIGTPPLTVEDLGPEGEQIVRATLGNMRMALQHHLDDIADIIDAGEANGDSMDKIASDVRQAQGTSSWPANAARHIVGTMNGARTVAATQAGGVRKRWVATDDARTRISHREADGQVRDMGDTFRVGKARLAFPGDPTGPPGEVINCLPGDQRVEVVGRLESVARAWWDGPFVRIVTDVDALTVTPNHPILTPDGWVAAQALHEGDEVLGIRTPDGKPDVHHMPPTAAEVFSASLNRGTAGRVVPGAVNFHGDRPAGEVDVVRVNGYLRDGFDPSLGEHGLDLDFVGLSLTHRLGAGDSSRTHRLLTAGVRSGSRTEGGEGLTAGFLGSEGPGAALVRRETVVHQEVGFGSSAWSHTFRPEIPVDGSTGDPEGDGQGQDGLAFEVAPYKITKIEVDTGGQWVYNLSTSTGLLVSGGIVHSNCRCAMVFQPYKRTVESEDALLDQDLAELLDLPKRVPHLSLPTLWDPSLHPRDYEGRFRETPSPIGVEAAPKWHPKPRDYVNRQYMERAKRVWRDRYGWDDATTDDRAAVQYIIHRAVQARKASAALDPETLEFEVRNSTDRLLGAPERRSTGPMSGLAQRLTANRAERAADLLRTDPEYRKKIVDEVLQNTRAQGDVLGRRLDTARLTPHEAPVDTLDYERVHDPDLSDEDFWRSHLTDHPMIHVRTKGGREIVGRMESYQPSLHIGYHGEQSWIGYSVQGQTTDQYGSVMNVAATDVEDIWVEVPEWVRIARTGTYQGLPVRLGRDMQTYNLAPHYKTRAGQISNEPSAWASQTPVGDSWVMRLGIEGRSRTGVMRHMPDGTVLFVEAGTREDGTGRINNTQQSVTDVAGGLPDHLRDRAIRSVAIVDGPSPNDSYWSEKFGIPDFSAAASNDGRGNTTVWNGRELGTGVLAHEVGHTLDRLGSRGSGTTLSESPQWKDAQRRDTAHWNNTGRAGLIMDGGDRYRPTKVDLRDGVRGTSVYGLADRPHEDFAEAVYLYLYDRKHGQVGSRVGGATVRFADLYPNRAAILDGVFSRIDATETPTVMVDVDASPVPTPRMSQDEQDKIKSQIIAWNREFMTPEQFEEAKAAPLVAYLTVRPGQGRSSPTSVAITYAVPVGDPVHKDGGWAMAETATDEKWFPAKAMALTGRFIENVDRVGRQTGLPFIVYQANPWGTSRKPTPNDMEGGKE